jgi:uncharacterized OsmC-like protein
MAEITAKYLGGLSVESKSLVSGATLFTNASAEIQDKSEGFSPVEVLAVALGACAMSIMGFYAKNHDLNIVGATLETSLTMSESSPHRVTLIEIIFTMPGRDCSDKDKKSLERAAKSCPVYNSLHPEIEKRFSFNWVK